MNVLKGLRPCKTAGRFVEPRSGLLIPLGGEYVKKKPEREWTAPQKLDTQLIKVQFFMAKPKYSFETRLAVVDHYLAGHDGA
ncbi:hypothetical protein ACWXWI_20480, partial [Pantoea ananatis]